jgi:hypothetical protein
MEDNMRNSSKVWQLCFVKWWCQEV